MSQRLRILDIIRGIAILMVIFINVIPLSGPQFGMLDPYANGIPSTSDLAVHHVVRVFVQGKFITIFALLFGMGLALQTDRLGDSAGRIYVRRQVLLMAMGVLHGVFLWWGDILFSYGAIGLGVFLFRAVEPKTLRILATLGIATGSLMQASAMLGLPMMEGYLEHARALDGDMPPEVAAIFDDVFGWFSALELRVFGGGPWWAVLGLRSALFAGNAIGGLFAIGPWVGGLMLLGIVFVREDFVHDTARQGWWIRWGLCGGLVVEVLTGAVGSQFELVHPIGASCEALSWCAKAPTGLGVFAWLCRYGQGLTAFAAAGRMALTNYIGQSVLMNLIFAHWALGLFGEISRSGSFLICVLLGVFQVALSNAWLQRYPQGPLEAAWRWATYRASSLKRVM